MCLAIVRAGAPLTATFSAPQADALDGMEEEATDYVTNYYEESDGEGSDGGEATL